MGLLRWMACGGCLLVVGLVYGLASMNHHISWCLFPSCGHEIELWGWCTQALTPKIYLLLVAVLKENLIRSLKCLPCN